MEEANERGEGLDQFEDAYERMGRYLILTNGGGAVAASAFLGSTMAAGHRSRWAVMPLIFFLWGSDSSRSNRIWPINLSLEDDGKRT